MSKTKVFLLAFAVMVAAMAFTLSCSLDDGEEEGGSGGGSGTGYVTFKNASSLEVRDLTLTHQSGEQIGYYRGPVRASNGIYNFGAKRTGLITITFVPDGATRIPTQNFTLSEGETVTVNFTSNYNITISRSSGSGGGQPDGPMGFINVTNNCGSTLYYLHISQNNVVSTNVGTGVITNGATMSYRAPVGTNKVTAARQSNTGLLTWETSVTVSETRAATVTIPSSGWSR